MTFLSFECQACKNIFAFHFYNYDYKLLILFETDGDGEMELVLGLTDHVLRTYRWVKINPVSLNIVIYTI